MPRTPLCLQKVKTWGWSPIIDWLLKMYQALSYMKITAFFFLALLTTSAGAQQAFPHPLIERYEQLLEQYPVAFDNDKNCRKLVNQLENLRIDLEIRWQALSQQLETDALFKHPERQSLADLSDRLLPVSNFVAVLSGCRDLDRQISLNYLQKATEELRQKFKIIHKNKRGYEVWAFRLRKIRKRAYVFVNKTSDTFPDFALRWVNKQKGKKMYFNNHFAVPCQSALFFATTADGRIIKKLEQVKIETTANRPCF